MASQSYERELGAVQVKLESLATGQAAITELINAHKEESKEERDKINTSLNAIKTRFDQMDGAWKATAVIGSVGGIIGGGIVWIAKIILAIPLR